MTAQTLRDTTATDSPLLELPGISKSFPGVRALDDVQLTLHGGEVLGLIGENGAGKSTLMKILSGIHPPDAGRIAINGRQVEILTPKAAETLGVSIIHQEFNLAADLSVAQNIFLGREPRSLGMFVSDATLNRRAAALLERVGVDLDPRTRVGDLTVAGQQMVEIAKALSVQSDILIMDEPTAALNDAEVAALHDIIRGFVSPTTGVIYISHRMEELKRITDRITVLRDGQYIDTVDTPDTELRTVIAMMVGREITAAEEPAPAHIDAAAPPALEVEGLSTKRLLRDVSFSVRRGEILGFAGLMGAGRTEVARAVIGADPHTAGTIRLDGTPVRLASPAAAAAAGIGYLSEDRKHLGLFLDRSVADNIALSSLPKLSTAGFVRTGAIRAAALSAVDTLRIKTPSIGQQVKNLSGGNQQKVVTGKWLLHDSGVLIFDEPTRGIDVGAKEEIYALLQSLAEQGKAIIVISSELPEVLRLCHRVAVMSEGRLAGTLDAAEASQESIMELATAHSQVTVHSAPQPTDTRDRGGPRHEHHDH
ncbi:ribose transport system ATP-binding protein [Brevibacterium pityocampae]